MIFGFWPSATIIPSVPKDTEGRLVQFDRRIEINAALFHRDDGVLLEAIGIFAGLGDGLVAGQPGGGHVEHALAAALAEFVALHEILEYDVPRGLAVPEIDLERAAGAAAQRIDAPLAFQLGIIGEPILAAVAVQVFDLEHRVGIRGAVHILADPRRLGDRLGDIVGRLGRMGGWERHRRGEDYQSRDAQEFGEEGTQFAPEAVLRGLVFLRAIVAFFLRGGLALATPQTRSFKCVGPLLNEAWMASPSRLVPNSDFQK